MFGGPKRRAQFCAFALAFSVSTVASFAHIAAARAADLGYGGDCCADLEERVANLEATTVRHASKKVQLQIYGVMNWDEMFWNDGNRSDAYTVNNGYTDSRFGFKGKAKISKTWSAGFRIEIGMPDDLSGKANQLGPDNSGSLAIRQSYVWLEGQNFGTVKLGHASTVKDDINKMAQPVKGLNDTETNDLEFARGFYLRPKGVKGDSYINSNTLKIGDIARCYSSSLAFDCSTRRDGVVYWSPKFAGFQVGADFAQNDTWGIGAKFKNTLGSFKLAADAAYEDISDDSIGQYYGGKQRIRETAGSASIYHVPTGLYALGAWTYSQEADPVTKNAGIYDGKSMPDMNGWDIQVGLHRHFLSPGAGTVFGGFTRVKNGIAGATSNPDRALAAGTFVTVNVPTEITGSQVDHWYLGYDQGFDSADMHLYVVYQHVDPSVSLINSSQSKVSAPLDNFDVVYTGMRIYF